MTDGLRVLIVDDNPDDRALAARELARGFPDIRTVEVADAATFETAVERGGFDLVITEFHLAWSDGLSVFRELKYRYPEIPVIMLTGAGSEEVAVEAMRVGLDDYVLKGPEHVVGLPVAATSVLERARERQARRQAEEALHSSEAHLRALVASMSDVILVLDRDGRYLEIAPTAPELLYRPAAEALGKTLHELFAPEQADYFLDAIRRALDTRSTVEIEYMLQIHDTGMWFQASISPMLEDSVVLVARDITERKRTEASLRESEEEHRHLVERANDGIAIIQDDVVRFANPHLAEMLGGGLEEILGTPFSDHIDPDELPKVAELYERRMAGEDVSPVYETVLKRRDGSRMPAELNAGVITREGKPADLVIVRDITERKEAEAERIAIQGRYRELFDNVRAGLCRTTPGPSGTFLAVNPAMVEMFEADDPEQLLTLHPSEIYLDESQRRIVSDAIVSKGFIDEEIRFKTLKGRPIWCRITSKKVSDANGQVYFDNTIEDVTERKRAEEALRESEERFRSLFELSADLVCIADISGYFRQINASFPRVLGYSQEELLGKPFMDFVHPDDRAKTVQVIEEKLSRGETVLTFENRYVRKDGGIVWLEWTSQPSVTKDCTYAIARDITERKRMEEALAERMQELARANTELQRFAYVASHDLQEPLRMIASYVQLIEKRYGDKLDADGQDFMGFVVDGANRLQTMINDLLEYSRVESRGGRFATVDCEELLVQGLQNLALSIEENGAAVAHDPLPRVMADPTQLVQVFQNLIENAIKFRGEEPPLIHVSARRGEGEWVFSVRDNGIGLDPEYNERIFIVFQRLGGMEHPGTGIGLSICKRIVERHKGRIWVESGRGKGATFYFTIPI